MINSQHSKINTFNTELFVLKYPGHCINRQLRFYSWRAHWWITAANYT